MTLAGEQEGLFTSAQALVRGMSRSDINRRMKQGYITQVRHGVYLLISAPTDMHREVRAAWLSLDPAKTARQRLQNKNGAVLCSTTAAEIYGAGIFYPERKDFYSPIRKQSSDKTIRIRIRKLDVEDINIVDGFLVVSPTVLVCDFLQEGRDIDDIAEVVRDLVQAEYELDWQKVFNFLPRTAARDGISALEITKTLMSPLLELALPISPYQLDNAYFPPGFLKNLREVYEDTRRSAHEDMLAVLERFWNGEAWV